MHRRSFVSGVVLAAGASRRFSGAVPKQLYPWRGVPLVRRAATTALASGLDEVLVVVGHRGAEVAAAVEDLPVRLIDNPRWTDGQSTSVRAGLAAARRQARAAMFIPCDQPRLSASTIDRLLTAIARGAVIAVPVAAGHRGAPVVFGRRFFAALDRLRGDLGGRALLAGHAAEIVEVAVDEPAELADVDRLEDLGRVGV